ncbi:rod shape-determining protein MreD [Clostridium sp. A1-XYC3]|uniref:Rod shape-determining protein MreD n=1 Tax=Clostridium tanneri TaxID=3037988 RepID=A0ABU4JNZ1_9CLOT|nr:rod shape-determining protein MreD [Clostridium sp. A1-XYC3]MDW8799865.1 rod shape-determining protein MreD [Clostridium sp. A1-XYC3]
MKKIMVLALLSILFFILDNIFMPFLAVKTIYPSMVLVFIICYSIVNGKWEGLWLGVFCGLLQDAYFTSAFGLNAFVNMIVCLIAGVIGDNIFKEKRLIPVASCFILSFLKGILLLLILYLNAIYMDFKDILYISLYNSIVCVLLYKSIYKLCGKEYMQRRWKF